MTAAEEAWCHMMRASDEAALKVIASAVADPSAAAKAAAAAAAETAAAALAASLASASLSEAPSAEPAAAALAHACDVSAVVARVVAAPRCVVDLSDALRDNADVMAAAVEGDEFLLEYASPRLRDTEPLVLRAVQVQQLSGFLPHTEHGILQRPRIFVLRA
jgi:hypothetical protein